MQESAKFGPDFMDHTACILLQGGTVAAYAAAQVLPAEVAARAGAQGAPLMDLNALPVARAQPQVSPQTTHEPLRLIQKEQAAPFPVVPSH